MDLEVWSVEPGAPCSPWIVHLKRTCLTTSIVRSREDAARCSCSHLPCSRKCSRKWTLSQVFKFPNTSVFSFWRFEGYLGLTCDNRSPLGTKGFSTMFSCHNAHTAFIHVVNLIKIKKNEKKMKEKQRKKNFPSLCHNFWRKPGNDHHIRIKGFSTIFTKITCNVLDHDTFYSR